MAARRVAKSAVDWAAFADRVPPNQKDIFRAFKAKSDLFVSKVYQHPENLPAIDFAAYATKLGNVPMVAEFEKAYKTLTVAYPSDKNNLKAKIDAEEREAEAESKRRIADSQKAIADAKALLAKIDSVPDRDLMTIEMYAEYFPEHAKEILDKPKFFPFRKVDQPENNPHVIN
uniref:ATP synthase subunit d, mitochondrial n=1 Tax=Enchytraeus cf. crypticus SL-2017 TaxID=2052677 RepID=A0A286Q4Y2_9ANNE|nr:mitochondrial ATP synthase subunit d precursor [Enchytraeus cf. crypticus SL-2017]